MVASRDSVSTHRSGGCCGLSRQAAMLAVAVALLVQVEEQVLARPAAVCIQELAGVHAVDPAQPNSMSSPHILHSNCTAGTAATAAARKRCKHSSEVY